MSEHSAKCRAIPSACAGLQEVTWQQLGCGLWRPQRGVKGENKIRNETVADRWPRRSEPVGIRNFFPIKKSGKTQFDAVNESTSYPVTQKSNVKASFRKAVRLQAVDLKKNNHTARKNPIRCRKREHFLSCSSFFPIWTHQCIFATNRLKSDRFHRFGFPLEERVQWKLFSSTTVRFSAAWLMRKSWLRPCSKLWGG